jgi:hypothetical protein
MSNLLLTFDTDWVPPFFIEDVLSLVNDIPATFFVKMRRHARFWPVSQTWSWVFTPISCQAQVMAVSRGKSLKR